MKFPSLSTKLLAVAAFTVVAALGQNAPAPDNTKVNKGDGDKGAVTADRQKMNLSDSKLTQQIRKSIMSDKSLSTYAHNVKIISQHGKITLKGPVHSDEEKKAIESKAIEVAGGADRVDDQLSVKSN